MARVRNKKAAIECHPLTLDRWDDLVRLFGPRGACGGCWCMWWRLKRSEFDIRKGAGNKRAFKKVVAGGPPPGLIGYVDDDPVAWIALAPREDYSALERSRVLKPIDDKPVWSVTCFFVARGFRRMGVSTQMLQAATRYAKTQGARILEGYPVEPRGVDAPAAFVWPGLPGAFKKAGYKEVARRSPTRPIMRKLLR